MNGTWVVQAVVVLPWIVPLSLPVTEEMQLHGSGCDQGFVLCLADWLTILQSRRISHSDLYHEGWTPRQPI